MPLGIYKPDQGYWVRVLTAVFAGVLVLSGAGWAFQQLEAVQAPISGHELEVVAVEGEIGPGQAVTLLVEDDTGSQREIATAVVASTDATRIMLSDTEVTDPDRTVLQATSLRRDDAYSATVASVRAVRAFQTLYLQTAVAGVVAVVGLALVYWFVGVQRKFTEFLIATDGEMKKVNWSTWREVRGSTWVVVGASFLIAALLFIIDTGFQTLMRMLDVLQT